MFIIMCTAFLYIVSVILIGSTIIQTIYNERVVLPDDTYMFPPHLLYHLTDIPTDLLYLQCLLLSCFHHYCWRNISHIIWSADEHKMNTIRIFTGIAAE
jgi:hypothetical protein